MFSILHHDEDSASAALSELLKRSPKALTVFCKLIDSSGNWARASSSLEIENQHRTKDGRKIDMLIRNGNQAVIVECKVLDSIKPSQLRTYHEYWLDTTGVEPWLVWLVQRPQKVLGWGSNQAREITWNQLCDALACLNKRTSEGTLVASFCRALRTAEIVLAPGRCITKRKITKGYDQNHAARILDGILTSLSGVEGSIEEVNELPPALHLGRETWKETFMWITRVWVYLRPLSCECNVVCPFTFTSDLRIFKHGQRDTYAMEAPQFLHRAKICQESGLRIKRNKPGKWRGDNDLRFPFPVPAKAGLRWINAYDLAGLNPKSFFDWRNEKEAIKAGINYAQRLLNVVDRW